MTCLTAKFGAPINRRGPMTEKATTGKGASPAKQSAQKPLLATDEAALHKVFYNASTCPIKDDVPALASNWKSGHGPLTKNEAGLLLWHHCSRGEDGAADVVAAGAISSSLAVLDSADALMADKSLAAGLLLMLCQADAKHQEAILKAKAGQSSCCQILHSCILPPGDAVPRRVVALIACLASNAACLSGLLKALGGEVPWASYCHLVSSSHKDHAAAISAAKLVQVLVAQHEGRALEAAAAGMLEALLAAAAAHKSAAAVAALASCLLTLCEAAAGNCDRLGSLPGGIQQLVDLLGPPPATVVAWEKEQYQHILNPPPPVPAPTPFAAAAAGPGARPAPVAASVASSDPADARQISNSSSTTLGSQRLPANAKSLTPCRQGTDTGTGTGSQRQRSLRPVRSIILPDIGEMSEGPAGERQPESPNAALHSKSMLARKPTNSNVGAEQQAGSGAAATTTRLSRATKDARRSITNAAAAAAAQEHARLPQPQQPLLCQNSMALKWDGPVPEATKAAVAGVLGELVRLPGLCQAVSCRLGASRLAALVLAGMAKLDESPGKAKKKKKASKLVLPPDIEALLCRCCVCLRFLVAASNADCYRVAAAGCLPHLVQLAAEAHNTRLRQSAQAIVAQAALLAELQELVQQAQVPQELLVQVRMKLTDEEVKALLIEFPSSRLQRLDDVTARARV